MNFFSSVFSDDPSGSDSDSDTSRDSSPTDHPSYSSGAGAGAWEFGALWQTLSEKSESIIETYRRDLQEFGTGLKKEIEVAHDSLETVGHVIDHFGITVAKGTAQIISHGKDAILLDSNYYNNNNKISDEKKSFDFWRYSRFDAQVRAIQGDVRTYSQVPEDLDEYNDWKLGFSLEGKSAEMEGLLRENETMESLYKRVVPSVVDRDTFWFRYYFRVYKFKKAEDVRARLVRRMSREEEELSWDVEDDDDDDDDDDGYVGGDGNKRENGDSELHGTKRLNVEDVHKNDEEGSKEEKKNDLLQSNGLGEKKDESVEESEVVKEMGDGSKKSIDEVDNRNDSGVDSDKNVEMERKVDDEKEEEEDFEWDEIEDLSRIEEEKETRTGSPTNVDLRKRLSAAQEQEDEDLNFLYLYKVLRSSTFLNVCKATVFTDMSLLFNFYQMFCKHFKIWRTATLLSSSLLLLFDNL